MHHMIIGALEILIASLLIAAVAIALVVFRPMARRRRRRKRHSARPRIDLFIPPQRDAAAEPDA